MGGSNESLLKAIRHYRDGLERYTKKSESEAKILHCLEKLQKLPIKISHLEETGVGRTVNGLRKLGGEVAETAKKLVNIWKEMVVEEEENENTNVNESEIANGYETNDQEYNSNHSKSQSSTELEVKAKKHRVEKYVPENKPKHKSSHRHRAQSTEELDDTESLSYKNYEKKYAHSEEEDIIKSDINMENMDTVAEKHREKKKKKHSRDGKEEKTSISGTSKGNHKSSKERHSKDEKDKKRHSDEHLKKSSDLERTESRKRKMSESEDDSPKPSDDEPTKSSKKHSRRHHKSKKHKKHKQEYVESENSCNSDESEPGEKHKKTKNSKRIHSDEDDSDNIEHLPKKSKHSSTKRESTKSHKDEHRKSSKSESSFKEPKSKIDENKSLKSSESQKQKDAGKRDKRKSSSEKDKQKPEQKDRNGSSTSLSKEKSSKSNEVVKKKLVQNNVQLAYGIDSASGASFEEALGMCYPIAKVSKKKQTSRVHESFPKESTSSKETSSSKETTTEQVPVLLKEPKLPSIDINISSLLPEITPNYRPLGLPVDDSQKRVVTDDESLSRVMSTKNQRTKVFSGNRSFFGKVPTLFELCIRVLQDNIDALEYTGGVPYLILKPILEKANADQLYMMEHHNPYLIEDTDELWKLHCQKEFKSKARQELESWREMYLRCLDEREARLKALTANIKLAQDKSLPVRTTKLAYVDSVAKPPRNIARKQAKNGTKFDKRPSTTPSSRLAALATSGEAGKVAVPNPGSRATEKASTSSTSHSAKPKKAPLMLKTLSFFKNRFKR